MSDDKLARAAAARFFIRVEQVGLRRRDDRTLPLFPLLMVMDPEMLEADVAYEAQLALNGKLIAMLG